MQESKTAEEGKQVESYLQSEEHSDDCYITETAEKYFTRQGKYTLDDYYALPEDLRVELIEGTFFVMLAPSKVHQIACLEIYRQIANFIREHDGKCEVYAAPTDVQLNKDDKTIVEPDVFIVCHEEIDMVERVYGAPDFVLEVLSKSTEKKDKSIKMRLYKNAGVREYWILDPFKRIVTIYCFEKNQPVKVCGLDKPQPIGIYEGSLEIDFDYINKILDKYNQG